MNAEEILVALAIKYDGDWEKIMTTLNKRTTSLFPEEEESDDWTIDLEPYLTIAQNANYKYTTFLSPDYPEVLKHSYLPPFVIFYHGDLSLIQNIGRNVAIVGSRECSVYGEYMTRKIASGIADHFNVISGMAKGIDTIAHETVMQNGGKTIAVLGGGINNVYPSSNKNLYETIKKDHLVISEYPGDVIPQPTNFPRRNRLIAMLSRGIIVTEAYERSGTLTTVMFGMQNNRLILCVPYEATVNSQCNRLIAEGAYLVENAEQAIEVLKNDIHV